MRIKYLPLVVWAMFLAACSDNKTATSPAPAASSASTSYPASSAPAPLLPPGAVSFPNYGFTIGSLDTTVRVPQFQVLEMQVSPAPNPFPDVSVQLHVFNGTIADYLKQTHDDFAKLGITTVHDPVVSANEAKLEYLAITAQGIAVHWYTRMILSNGSLYAATGMALDVQWNQIGERIKASVDSFALNGASGGGSVSMPNYGFSIMPFDIPLNNYTVQPLMMALPPDGGFTPSVNVQIQPAPRGMDAYVKESQAGMSQMGYTVVSTKTVNNEWFLEYLGLVPVPTNDGGKTNEALHWYAHAIWASDHIYLATGGVPDQIWAKYSEQLKTCVESLKVTGKPVLAPTPPPAAASGNATPATPAATSSAPATGTAPAQ